MNKHINFFAFIGCLFITHISNAFVYVYNKSSVPLTINKTIDITNKPFQYKSDDWFSLACISESLGIAKNEECIKAKGPLTLQSGMATTYLGMASTKKNSTEGVLTHAYAYKNGRKDHGWQDPIVVNHKGKNTPLNKDGDWIFTDEGVFYSDRR